MTNLLLRPSLFAHAHLAPGKRWPTGDRKSKPVVNGITGQQSTSPAKVFLLQFKARTVNFQQIFVEDGKIPASEGSSHLTLGPGSPPPEGPPIPSPSTAPLCPFPFHSGFISDQSRPKVVFSLSPLRAQSASLGGCQAGKARVCSM